MTTYSAVANTEIAVGAPITNSLMTKLRDNPIAITEGATGAPLIQLAAMGAGSVGNSQLITGAVHTAELSTGGGTTSTGAGTTITASMTGGRYVFWPQVYNTGGTTYFGTSTSGNIFTTSASYVSTVSIYAVGGTGHVQWLYVATSPPYDTGDGDIPLFVWAVIDNATRKIIALYFSDDPIWLHNGVTNNYPDGNDSKGPYQLIKDIPVAIQTLQGSERASAVREIPFHKNYITQEQKHRDMNDIPHPFLNVQSGQTVVMLDPVSACVRDLSELRKEGEDIDIILRNNIDVGNTGLKRSGPNGLLIPSVHWKNTK